MDEPNKILILDTETTGLPPRNTNPAMYTKWDMCRVVQIAWHIYDQHGNLEEKVCMLVKPTFQIPESSTAIHGITQEMAEKEGVPMWKVLDMLGARLPRISHLVAHNLEFDRKVILSEMARYNDMEMYNVFNSVTGVCTMLTNTLPGQRWPKLVDLYKRLFEREPEGRLHQADTDVQLCADIYFRTR
jgi:DNA polymerase-3 subunit alpha